MSTTTYNCREFDPSPVTEASIINLRRLTLAIELSKLVKSQDQLSPIRPGRKTQIMRLLGRKTYRPAPALLNSKRPKLVN